MSRDPHMLEKKITQCKSLYNRILLVVGNFGTGKTKLLQQLSKLYNYPYINLNLALSSRLLSTNVIKRNAKLDEIISNIIEENDSEVILIDNIEIMFDPELKRDALKTFRLRSRNRTLVISWPGKYENAKLIYAEPRHPEYFEEKVTDLIIHNLIV